jgi:hypothetical protein
MSPQILHCCCYIHGEKKKRKQVRKNKLKKGKEGNPS